MGRCDIKWVILMHNMIKSHFLIICNYWVIKIKHEKKVRNLKYIYLSEYTRIGRIIQIKQTKCKTTRLKKFWQDFNSHTPGSQLNANSLIQGPARPFYKGKRVKIMEWVKDSKRTTVPNWEKCTFSDVLWCGSADTVGCIVLGGSVTCLRNHIENTYFLGAHSWTLRWEVWLEEDVSQCSWRWEYWSMSEILWPHMDRKV